MRWILNPIEKLGDYTKVYYLVLPALFLLSLYLLFGAHASVARAASLGDGVQSVSTGYQTTCAVARNKVYCWGKGFVGGVFNSPQLVSASTINGKSITKVSVGFDHACVLADAEVYCWGNNQVGQLGDGTTSNRTSPVEVKQDGVLKSKEIMDIATGDGFTCALASDSTTACWGDRTNGRIGDGGSTSGKEPNPKAIYATGALANKKAISLARAGNATMCVIAASSSNNSPTSGSAYCWGFGIDDGSSLPSSGTKTDCLASPPVSTTTYLSSNRPILIPKISAVDIVGQIGDTDSAGIPTTGYMSAVSSTSGAYYWGRYGYTVNYTQGSACGDTPATPPPPPPATPPPPSTCSGTYWAGSSSLVSTVGNNFNPDLQSSSNSGNTSTGGSAKGHAASSGVNSSMVVLAGVSQTQNENESSQSTATPDTNVRIDLARVSVSGSTAGQNLSGSHNQTNSNGQNVGGGNNNDDNNGPTPPTPIGKVYLLDCTGAYVTCDILLGLVKGVVSKTVYRNEVPSAVPAPAPTTASGSGNGKTGSAAPSTGGSARNATSNVAYYYSVSSQGCDALVGTNPLVKLLGLIKPFFTALTDRVAAMSTPDATARFATAQGGADARLAATTQGHYYTSTVTPIGQNSATAPPTYPSTSSGIRLLAGNVYEGNNGGLVCVVWSGSGTYCDGHGTSTTQGQLGNGSSAQQSGAKQVYDAAKTNNITDISTATNYTCVIIGGNLECWGQNSNGQLGVGNSQNQNQPTRVISWP